MAFTQHLILKKFKSNQERSATKVLMLQGSESLPILIICQKFWDFESEMMGKGFSPSWKKTSTFLFFLSCLSSRENNSGAFTFQAAERNQDRFSPPWTFRSDSLPNHPELQPSCVYWDPAKCSDYVLPQLGFLLFPRTVDFSSPSGALSLPGSPGKT